MELHQLNEVAMKNPRKYIVKSLAVVVSFLIALPPLRAQTQTVPVQLNIVVVEGEGAINNIRERVARDPVVRVEDENHKPVAGAAIVFTLPTEGATGEFTNGSKTLTAVTDSKGQAAAQGLKMNPISGKVPIHVTVSYRGLAANTSIMQFSVLPPGAKPARVSSSSSSHGHGLLIGVLVAVGAAAAGGGAYFATRSQSSSTASTPTPTGPTPIGITAGTGTIGGGH